MTKFPVTEPAVIYTLAKVINRIAIAVVGIGWGVVMIWPNAMMCDSGTRLAVTVAYIGITACILLVIRGFVGLFSNIGWWALLPGLLCQIVIIIPMIFNSENYSFK